MIPFSGVQDFLYFVQAWHLASKLRLLLDYMEVPKYRKDVTELHTLQWLSHNLHIDNFNSPFYEEARRLLDFLFNDSRYRELKREMWRTEICS